MRQMLQQSIGGLKIQGYSRAAEETCFILPAFRLAFDVGMCPQEMLATKYLFLSHFHMDHIAGLFYYIAYRSLRKMASPKIFLHHTILSTVKKMIRLFEKLEDTQYTYELIPLYPEKEIFLPKGVMVVPFATSHRIVSLGFTIYQKQKKLKKEFKNKRSHEISNFVKEGKEVSEIKKNNLLSYSGDTAIEVLDLYPPMLQSKILLLECTFLVQKHLSLAKHTKHIHLQEIQDREKLFQNQHILLTHFSLRYSKSEIRKTLKKTFSSSFFKKIIPWL